MNFRGWFKEQDDPGKRCSHGGIRLERQEIYGAPVPETAAFSEELLLGRLGSWRVLWDGEGKSVEHSDVKILQPKGAKELQLGSLIGSNPVLVR